MSLYQRPLQPWDPVVQDQQIKPPVRYIRDNFQGTGQDSHTQPPAQDPAMWQALTNVQPITKGVIERRWGFTQFATGLNIADSRLFSFQRDSDGLRTILAQGSGIVQAFTESGSSYNNSVFTPAGAIVRSLTSNNYQYFFDGLAPDLKKWDGIASGGVTNWGINVNNVTVNVTGGGTSQTTFGPNNPGTTSQAGSFGQIAFSNLSSLSSPPATTGVFLTGATSVAVYSETATTTNYNMSAAGGTIVGIEVSMSIKVTGTFQSSQLVGQLVKAGSPYGNTKYQNINVDGTQTITLGGPTDLWGGTWSLLDVNSTNFGTLFQCMGQPKYVGIIGGQPHYQLNETISIFNCQITVYTQAVQGSGSSSGNGIGITGIIGGGLVTLTLGRTYYLAFYNANSGHFSDISPPSANTGPTNNAQIELILATSNDPQVTHKYILATADGGDPSILYQVAELVNGGAGDVTTYTDNTPDTTLVENQELLFTDQTGTEFGITLNDPPPAGTLCIKHQGRLWMAGVPGATHSIFFSKGISDLTLPNGFIGGKYEESWPGSNYLDISDGAESVNALLSDGQTLYIGSQYHVRRITGNDPTNFSLPEIVHPQVGVINQESAQLVYTQGSPAGAIWLTPDFRVIQSDFNTYQDIGTRIQDILNNLQPSAPQLAHAQFVADGEYDLFILAVPYQQSTYCDTHLVYDMRNAAWFVWQPTNGSLSLLYNVNVYGQPQWLFITGAMGSINQYQQSALSDNGTAFTITATTSWLNLGEPGQRKVLNELDYDGDPALTATINTALLQSDFVTPNPLITNAASTLGPLGTRKFYLAASATKARYFQFTFQSTSTQDIILGTYNVESVPFTDL